MLVLKIEKEGLDLFETIMKNEPDSIDVEEIEYSFDGGSFLQVFVDITEFTLPVIASILVSKRGKNKVIVVKKDGMEISIPIDRELTVEEMKEFLEKYINE